MCDLCTHKHPNTKRFGNMLHHSSYKQTASLSAFAECSSLEIGSSRRLADDVLCADVGASGGRRGGRRGGGWCIVFPVTSTRARPCQRPSAHGRRTRASRRRLQRCNEKRKCTDRARECVCMCEREMMLQRTRARVDMEQN